MSNRSLRFNTDHGSQRHGSGSRVPLNHMTSLVLTNTTRYYEPPDAYYRRKVWCTVIYGICYFAFGLVLSSLGGLIQYLHLASPTHRPYLSPLVIGGKSAGSLLGAIMGSGPLSNFPTIGHAIIAITFLILIICYAVQPILSAFSTLIAIWFFIGICCGLLDTTINTILLRMWGPRVDNKMQAIHLVSGIGSTLSPVIILTSLKWTGCYHFGVWFISAISLIAGLLPLFVRMPILDLDIWEPRRAKRVKGEHVIIGLLAALLFVTNGLDVSVSNWLLTWNAVRMEFDLPRNETAPLIPILSGNDTATPVLTPAELNLPKCVLPVWPPPHTFDPTALPDGPFLLLSLYWASYTLARLIGLPLITRAGPRVLTLIVIVGVSIAVAVYQLYTTSFLVTWVCTGLIGFFIANLFPNVIALPANFGISITSPDSMKLLIGAGIGEIVWPIVSGEVWLYLGPEFTHYGLLGTFTLAAILFLAIMIVLTCSKSLQQRDSLPSTPRTPVLVTPAKRSTERTPLLTNYQDM